MSKKVLITGASGFVGGFLVEEALNQGLQVDAAIRKSSSKDYLQDERINFVYINLNDIEELASILKKGQYDYIIHNAGLTRSKDPSKLYDVNEGSIRTFTTAIEKAEADIKKFTFVSSLAAYGPADFDPSGVVSNASTPHPVTHYGKSKLAGEKILIESGLPYTIIRPTAVYGPREKDLLTLYQMINKGLNVEMGFTPQKLTFIYVKDLVRAIVDMTTSTKTTKKTYFISDGNTYSARQLADTVKGILRKKVVNIKLPIAVVKIIGAISELYGKVTGGFPPLNREKVNELGARSWVCDVQPLVEDIDFAPQFDLEKGLSEAIPWYREKGML